MKTITISRQYGSGGRRVASMLSEKLGINFYDNNLLLIAGEKYGISPGLMNEYDEKKGSSFLYGIGMLADGYTNEDREPRFRTSFFRRRKRQSSVSWEKREPVSS